MKSPQAWKYRQKWPAEREAGQETRNWPWPETRPTIHVLVILLIHEYASMGEEDKWFASLAPRLLPSFLELSYCLWGDYVCAFVRKLLVDHPSISCDSVLSKGEMRSASLTATVMERSQLEKLVSSCVLSVTSHLSVEPIPLLLIFRASPYRRRGEGDYKRLVWSCRLRSIQRNHVQEQEGGQCGEWYSRCFVHLPSRLNHMCFHHRSIFEHPLFSPVSKVFDKHGEGTVATSELRAVLTSMGEKLPEEEVRC